jgi:hypothetical protein
MAVAAAGFVAGAGVVVLVCDVVVLVVVFFVTWSGFFLVALFTLCERFANAVCSVKAKVEPPTKTASIKLTITFFINFSFFRF